MTAFTGVAKIVRFNWPWYAGAAATTVAAILLFQAGALPGARGALAGAAVLVADFWLVASLAVSHWVYDRSSVARGEWMGGVGGGAIRRAAIFHAGQDEASSVVARVLPAAEVRVFDFHDPARNGTPSLERARATAGRRAAAVAPDDLLVGDGTLDLGVVVFAAHEMRRPGERAAFFRELARALAPAGRALVVEHLRDGWNFLAYGPGAFHFLSRSAWRRSFADGGLTLLRETSCTPFVRVFELEKAR